MALSKHPTFEDVIGDREYSRKIAELVLVLAHVGSKPRHATLEDDGLDRVILDRNAPRFGAPHLRCE